MIEISFLNRLSEINLFTPATVVNTFGLDRNTVAKTFAKMGPSYVFPQSMRDPTTNLVMAARALVLNFHFHKSKKVKKSWQQLKKSSSFNHYFETLDEREFQKIEAFLQDRNNRSLALQEMRSIRQLIRQWARTDDGSILSTRGAIPKLRTPQIHVCTKRGYRLCIST